MACKYEPQIRETARRYGIDENIAVRQIIQESGCNPTVCSYQAACGLTQFTSGTWATYGNGSRIDPQASLEAWGRYMSHLLSKFGGDYRLALAGYHSGEGSAVAALNNCKGNPKTCAYVSTIMGNSANPSSPSLPSSISDIGSFFSNMSPTTMVLVGLGFVLFLRR